MGESCDGGSLDFRHKKVHLLTFLLFLILILQKENLNIELIKTANLWKKRGKTK